VVQRRTYWWFLNVFRNVFYPFEVFYHFLFYGALFSWLIRRPCTSAFCYILALGSNPFLGIKLTAVLGPAILWDCLAPRGSGSRRRRQRVAAIAALVAWGLFVGYYGLFLPSFEVARALIEQHRGAYAEPPTVVESIVGYGPLGLLTLISLVHVGFLKATLRRRAGRFLAFWIVAVGLLIHHSRFSGPTLQPMHFTRGDLFLPLVIWSLRYIVYLYSKISSRLSFRRRGLPLTALLWLLCGLTLPDTVAFIAQQYVITPVRGAMIFSRAQAEVFDHFQGYQGCVLVQEPTMAIMLSAETGSKTLWGDRYITPHFAAREQAYRKFLMSGDYHAFRQTYSVTAFALPRGEVDRVLKADPRWLKRIFPSDQFQTTLVNSEFIVFRKL
jgi:hypothetical protein